LVRAFDQEIPRVNVADENAEVVRRSYRALNEADFEALTRCFDEKASWQTPGRSPIAGQCRGRDLVFVQFARYDTETCGTFTVALQDVLAGDDGRVVALHLSSAERNGRRLEVTCCVALQIKNGRIVSGREHVFELYEWDAFWS